MGTCGRIGGHIGHINGQLVWDLRDACRGEYCTHDNMVGVERTRCGGPRAHNLIGLDAIRAEAGRIRAHRAQEAA